MPSDRNRAALYVRISLDREGKALGVDRQEQACRELCAREGYEVAEVYRDNDVSASRYAQKRRPQYEAMLAAARGGQVDVLVAYSSSRFTRRLRDALDLIDLAESGRVQIRTVVSGRFDLATATGRAMAKVTATFDELESEVNSERSREERAQRRERGMPNGGTRPFGWQKDGITPHPDEWPALLDGIRDAIAGVSLRQVARDWSAVKGGTVTSTTVRRVLLSERIAGRLPTGEAGVWRAAATPDEVAALRGVLARPSPPRSVHCLLTGWALCGLCGAPVHGAVNRLGVACYECAAAPHLRVPREPRDALVLARVAAYLDREAVVTAVDTGPLSARHAALTANLVEVADMLVSGEFDREQAARATAGYRAQLAAVEADLAAAAGAATLPGSGEAFLALDQPRQRAVLERLPWRVRFLSPGRGARTFDAGTVVPVAL